MANIYNRRLDYEVLASGKRVLERPTKIVVPKYAVVGNTAPNLNFQVNRLLQPLTQTKKPLQQTPFVPKQPVQAAGLGGRAPYYIDYVVPERKSRKAEGLLWEPNTIREMRGNVYPDGLPKNNIPAQSADSQYIEYQNNQKKQKEIETKIEDRSLSGGHDGKRPHPNDDVEAELKRLDDMLAETKYGKGPYKNIALNAEQHREMAEKQAREIKEELEKLSSTLGEEPAVALDEKTFEETRDDPKKLDAFYKDFVSKRERIPTAQNSEESIRTRTLMILGYLQSQGYDPTDKDTIDQAQEWARTTKGGLGFRITNQKPFETRIDGLVLKTFGSKSKPIIASSPPSKSKPKSKK